MLRWKRTIALVLLLSTAWLVGCPGSHSNFASSRKSSSPAKLSVGPSSHESFAIKHPPHDAAFSVYNNPAYGISFRYPRNYVLKEEFDPDDSDLLRKEEELKTQQPDAVLVAVVLIPDDAYPNTTFAGASLQLVINPAVTLEACRSFAAPADEAYTFGSISMQGVTFDWRQRGFAAAGTGSLDRDYTGFSNGTCYEFFLEVVTGSNPDLDPRIKDADEVKIMRHLDKIVSSLQIHSASTLLSAK